MTYEDLYFFTMDDLKEKMLESSEYFLIRACGLLRHLLLDSPPLFHIVNRKYNLEIKFIVTDKRESIQSKNAKEIHKDAIKYLSPIPVDGLKKLEINHEKFLRYIIVEKNEVFFIVADIIKVASHVKGGVHCGKPDSKDQVLLNWENYGISIRIDLMTIKAICRIVLKGLNPLYDAITTKKTER